MTRTYHFELQYPEHPLGVTLEYLDGQFVKPFGRERDKDGKVVYYWVVDEAGKRFKAYPNELKA